MSKLTEIHSANRVNDFMDVFRGLMNQGYGIAVTDEKPPVSFYLPGISTRFIEITEEEYGYDVRLLFIASYHDFKLYRDAITQLLNMTNGKAEYEDGTEFTDAEKFFTEEFIIDSIDADTRMLMMLLKEEKEVGIDGQFRKFFFGPEIRKKLSLLENRPTDVSKTIWSMIRKSQYENMDAVNTPIYSFSNDSKPQEKAKEAVIYMFNKYDYILYAEYFGLMNKANDEYFFICYEKLHEIKPSNWELYDEKQYKAGNLTDQQ